MPFITMYHPSFPGSDTYTTLDAYRYEWYPLGWRSDDDPGWTGDPGTPPPAEDLAEHIAMQGLGTHIPTTGTDNQVLTRTGSGVAWEDPVAGTGAVDSVNGETGVVVLTAAEVGAVTSSDIATAISTHASVYGAGGHLPTGGTTGQVPTKSTGDSVVWSTVSTGPAGTLDGGTPGDPGTGAIDGGTP